MRFCPSCDRYYPDTVDLCEDDDIPLLPVPPDREDLAETLRGRVLDGRFRIIEKIGAGGMGTVFSAEQLIVGRRVALKVLPPSMALDTDAVKRFWREARAACSFTHPNAVTVHDFGQAEDGLLYLVMELIEGYSLAHVLRGTGALSKERVGHILRQILDVLQDAHERGIVHRDIKPGNVLLSPRVGDPDQVKVVDFGLAKVAEGAEESALTHVGQILGTPSYMAPEQVRGEVVDLRADLYSLGVLAFEMLGAQLPFEAESTVALLMKHVREPPPAFGELRVPVDVPAELAAWVYRMLAKRPEDRFGSALEARNALETALGTASAEAPDTRRSSVMRLDSEDLSMEPTIDSIDRSALDLAAHEAPTPRLTRPEVAPAAQVGRGGASKWLLAGFALLAASALGWWVSRPEAPTEALPPVASAPPAAPAAVAAPAPAPADARPPPKDAAPPPARPDSGPADAARTAAKPRRPKRRRPARRPKPPPTTAPPVVKPKPAGGVLK